MKVFPGLLAAAVLVAGLSAGALAQDANNKMAAPAAQRGNVGNCHEVSESVEQLQSDVTALRAELAVMHQMLADMQAQQKPVAHSVADVPGK